MATLDVDIAFRWVQPGYIEKQRTFTAGSPFCLVRNGRQAFDRLRPGSVLPIRLESLRYSECPKAGVRVHWEQLPVEDWPHDPARAEEQLALMAVDLLETAAKRMRGAQ